MTLVVSARVPDGIVMAADSLATLSLQAEGVGKGTTVCPHCGKRHDVEIPIQLPPGFGTLTTLPYALKLIPLYSTFGVGTFGQSILGSRTVFSLVREFETQGANPGSLKQLAHDLGDWLHRRVTERLQAEGRGVDALPEEGRVLGFQLAGYEENNPVTLVVSVGRQVKVDQYGDFGVTVSGETTVVTQLWKLKQTHPQMASAYASWSVLDAVDYVKFLISATASFQRFALMVPNVGGDIHIGLVTYQGFSWVERTPLADLLLQRPNNNRGERGD